jgi:hypothetical protein
MLHDPVSTGCSADLVLKPHVVEMGRRSKHDFDAATCHDGHSDHLLVRQPNQGGQVRALC